MLSTPEMSTKMKGLLKGLRYISQIFENKEEDEEEEEEMTIGFPTDVKHVAHIGWDGPSVTSPSWMNDFRGTPESASAPLNSNGEEAKETSAQKSSTQDSTHPSGGGGGGGASVGVNESPARDMPDLPKPARRRRSSGAQSFDATSQDAPVDMPPKQSSRRQKPSSSGLTVNSPAKDETSFEGVKPSKKSPKELKEDSPCIPKSSRRKKTKGSTSSGGSSTGSTKSRPKNSSTTSTYTSPFSDPGTGSSAAPNTNINEANCPTSALKGLQLGENGCDTSSVS